jgi:hypothetical protein
VTIASCVLEFIFSTLAEPHLAEASGSWVSAGSSRYTIWPGSLGGWKQQASGMRS